MDKKSFWELVEKQWRQVVSEDLLTLACQGIEKDIIAMKTNKPVKNIWECLDDEEDDDE